MDPLTALSEGARTAYGWRVALYIAGVMYVSMVTTALLLHVGFGALGITPESQRVVDEVTRFAIDYTFWLNLAMAGARGLAGLAAPPVPGHGDGRGRDGDAGGWTGEAGSRVRRGGSDARGSGALGGWRLSTRPPSICLRHRDDGRHAGDPHLSTSTVEPTPGLNGLQPRRAQASGVRAPRGPGEPG